MTRQERRLVLISRSVGAIGLLSVLAQYVRITYYLGPAADSAYVSSTRPSLAQSSLAMLFILATPMVYRATKSINTAAVWLLASGIWAILIAATTNMGGQSLVLYWLICTPLVGVLLVGRRAAIAATLLSFAALAAIHAFDHDLPHWVEGARAMDFNAELTVGLVGKLFMVTIIALLYERIRAGANEAVDALRSSRERERQVRHQVSQTGAALDYQRSILDQLATQFDSDRLSQLSAMNDASEQRTDQQYELRKMLRPMSLFRDLQSLETGKLRVQSARCDVQDVLQRVVGFAADRARHLHTSLALALASEPKGEWRTDSGRLEAILGEFVHMAVEAYPGRAVVLNSRFERQGLNACY